MRVTVTVEDGEFEDCAPYVDGEVFGSSAVWRPVVSGWGRGRTR
ncbi:MAG: hypothetical protein ACYTG3_02500 [Planctomycetota bacterium]